MMSKTLKVVGVLSLVSVLITGVVLKLRNKF